MTGAPLLTAVNIAGTHHLVQDQQGLSSWQNPMVPGKGRYKSALGRMGKSAGDDNATYGTEPYFAV
jgi:hypothetical protein